MTTADRVNARGRSLFDWGVLYPNAERRPTPYPIRGRAANVSQNTDARTSEYETYAPKGETCGECGKPFGQLERVRRLAVDRSSGAPAPGPYRHIKCGGAK